MRQTSTLKFVRPLSHSVLTKNGTSARCLSTYVKPRHFVDSIRTVTPVVNQCSKRMHSNRIGLVPNRRPNQSVIVPSKMMAASSQITTPIIGAAPLIAKRDYLRTVGDARKELRTTLTFATKDYPGALTECLGVFKEFDVNLTRIESRLGRKRSDVNFFIDVDLPPSHRKVKIVMEAMRPNCVFVDQVGSVTVPWFPVTPEEVDSLALLVLEGGIDLENPTHPGFNDPTYRERRAQLAQAAMDHRLGDEIKRLVYSKEEIECWATIWRRLNPLLKAHACDEYLQIFEEMQKTCEFGEKSIPQLADVSDFIYERSGFKLRPTAGLLSARHFLNGLAFNTFFCTQYLRHHAEPLYTPEPDLVHELIGHAPLFAVPEFARFSQAIGLASIGATDEQIIELARCYWFSVEFGLCKGGKGHSETKIYGAGILSSFGEIEHAMKLDGTTPAPEIREWDPFKAAKQDYPITTYQPIYWLAESFDDAKEKMEHYAASLTKRFSVAWDERHETLIVDANITRGPKDDVGLGTYGS